MLVVAGPENVENQWDIGTSEDWIMEFTRNHHGNSSGFTLRDSGH